MWLYLWKPLTKMKKAIVLLVLLSMVFPLRAQFVGPFDTKIVNNALFRPYDSMSMNRDYPMLVVKKGTHVKVVNRSKIGSGWYRVKLDDGSIGWVSAEAFCEKGTVPTENGTYEVGGGKSRNIFVGKYDKEIDLLVTAKMSSQAYAVLCQSIELLMLPESFRYLPPYTFEERGAYYVSDYDHVKGYTHKELQAMFGEPEGRIDKGFTKNHRGLGAIDYYGNVFYAKARDKKDLLYSLGYEVKYDKNGIARENGGTHEAVIPSSKINYDIFSTTFERKFQSDIEYTYTIKSGELSTAYADIYTPKGQKYSIPQVTAQLRADNDAYYKSLTAANNKREKAIKDAQPDPFRKVFWHLVLFLIVAYVVWWLLLNYGRIHYTSPYGRFLVLLVVMAVAMPWPTHLLDGGDVGFWGKCGLVIGLASAVIFMINFWYRFKLTGICKCPSCGRWVLPYINGEHRINPRIDNAPVYTQANRRIKVGTASPYSYIHKFNNDKESESRTEFNDLFIVETTVCLKYKRSAEKCCPRCLHNWSVEGENVTEELLGPIAFVTETWTKHDYTEVTKLGDKVIREEDRTYTDLTHKGANFDYDNWEPYFRRYEKGDKHALEEYYEKFFK